MFKRVVRVCLHTINRFQYCVIFWPFDPTQNAIQGDAPEESDTFQWQLGEEIAWVEIGWWNGTS